MNEADYESFLIELWLKQSFPQTICLLAEYSFSPEVFSVLQILVPPLQMERGILSEGRRSRAQTPSNQVAAPSLIITVGRRWKLNSQAQGNEYLAKKWAFSVGVNVPCRTQVYVNTHLFIEHWIICDLEVKFSVFWSAIKACGAAIVGLRWNLSWLALCDLPRRLIQSQKPGYISLSFFKELFIEFTLCL